MFTGIITALGRVRDAQMVGDAQRLTIEIADFLSGVMLGDSIAVNGCCLTVVEMTEGTFSVDVSPETLRCTNLGALTISASVNLEKAATLQQALGGHWVSGHVDATGKITNLTSVGEMRSLSVSVPEHLQRYIAKKGNITLNGVSLTVNEVNAEGVSLCLIPHTIAETTFQYMTVGDDINIEVDLLARYLERLVVIEPSPHKESACS